jgi:hypothetical protein
MISHPSKIASVVSQKSPKLTFSGHETFHCRSLWLKKGHDFVKEKYSFSQPDAVVKLGVGKNMVSAIKYWMWAFGFIGDGANTMLANFLFGDNGRDPFLESESSLWLLHFLLLKKANASIFRLMFEYFRHGRTEFTEAEACNFLRRQCEGQRARIKDSTIERDFGVFLRMYVAPSTTRTNLEENLSGLLIDLQLIERISTKADSSREDRYRIVVTERSEVPTSLLLYCILERTKENSTSFLDLYNGENGIGSTFAMNMEGLTHHLERIMRKYKCIVYKDDAGVRQIQIKSRPDPLKLLQDCYGA